MVIFKGSMPKLPFVSQQIDPEAAEETPAPPEHDVPRVEEAWAEPQPSDAASENSPNSSPVEDDLLVSSVPSVSPSLSFVAPLPRGSPGSQGAGTLSSVSPSSSGSVGSRATTQLFGVSLQAKKLGVIVDVSRSMQRYAPGLFKEIFEKFPDADVVLTNGGGMMDWETALKAFNDDVAARKKSAKDKGVDFRGATKLDKPKLARFNTGEAEDWVPVRGSRIDREDYRGLRADYPDLYEQMRKRGNTWFITSYSAANAVYLAFEQLIQRKAEAIYWFSDFADPIDGKEAEKVTQLIRDNRIEIILHSTKSRGKAAEWASQVDAKFVKAKF